MSYSILKKCGTLFLCIAMAFPAYAQTADTPASWSNDWHLVWAEEFDGDVINTDKWSFEINCWGGGNEERQCYTDDEKNARIENGVLSITAHRGRTKGYALPEHMRTTAKLAKKRKSKPFSSARLRTLGKGDWRYGRFEIRAKLPTGQGTWPAIWMLPSEQVYGTWAASGEIDIMEAVNLGVPCKSCDDGIENRVLGTLHYGDVWPDNKFSGTDTPLPGSIDEFHTYVIEWQAGKISWFVDGKVYATQTEEDWNSKAERAKGRPYAPFDQKFHLILNLAIGGGLPEGRNKGGIDKKGFPKSMLVDYVRIYQCAADPETGLGCGA